MASSWSRAVSGSTVTVAQGRKSARPRRSSRLTSVGTRLASASTSAGKASGRPCLAITTLRSTPGSSSRPRTSRTRPDGLRVAVGGRVISAETISPGSRARVVARRDEQLVQHAPVEGDHVAAEAPVLLVAAHDAL